MFKLYILNIIISKMYKIVNKILDIVCKVSLKIQEYKNPYMIDEIYIYEKANFRKIKPIECYNYLFCKKKYYVVFKCKNKYYVRYMRIYKLVDTRKNIINDYEYLAIQEKKQSAVSSLLQRTLAKQGVNANMDNITVNINGNSINIPLLIAKNEMHYRKYFDKDINIFIVLLLVMGKRKIDKKVHKDIVEYDRVLL